MKLFPQKQLMSLPIPLHPIKNSIKDEESPATFLLWTKRTTVHAVFRSLTGRVRMADRPLIADNPAPASAIICVLHPDLFGGVEVVAVLCRIH